MEAYSVNILVKRFYCVLEVTVLTLLGKDHISEFIRFRYGELGNSGGVIYQAVHHKIS